MIRLAPICLALVCLAMFLLPSIAAAEDACPWINQATAFGILSADGKPSPASTSETAPGSCTFLYRPGLGRSGKDMRELKVAVVAGSDAASMYQRARAECGSDIRSLVGIGNEAVTCVSKSEDFPRLAKVVGRVRDSYFIVTLASSTKNDPLLTPESARTQIILAAGQVAGNLF